MSLEGGWHFEAPALKITLGIQKGSFHLTLCLEGTVQDVIVMDAVRFLTLLPFREVDKRLLKPPASTAREGHGLSFIPVMPGPG